MKRPATTKPAKPVKPPVEAQPTLPEPMLNAAAGFWRRLGGFVVDWFLCFVLPSILSSLILLAVGYSARSTWIDGLWMLFVALVIFTYFTYFAIRGGSPGMAVAGIKLVDARTGEPPVLAKALIRGLLMTILIGSWFLLLLLDWGGGTGKLSNGEVLLLNLAYVAFLASFFGHLWIAWDRKRQTLQDKAAGIVVVLRNAKVEPVERPAQHIDPLEWRM